MYEFQLTLSGYYTYDTKDMKFHEDNGKMRALEAWLCVANEVGNYYYGDDTTDQSHKMVCTFGLDPFEPYKVNGPWRIAGNGTDDLGKFTLQGMIHQSGQVDLIKSYSGWGWKYLGRYDGERFAGRWEDLRPAHLVLNPTSGTYWMTREKIMDLNAANAALPTGRMTFGTLEGEASLALVTVALQHRGPILEESIIDLVFGMVV
ncbi:hypothetical protein CVT24_010372 [Panaeolus cyanescens]|uniref:Uncharacterized protein n=1 Tax=Panaeolus cyanescens TaxID=181874 RepID=A0A409VDH3_9AGAR|nr:hypothetical protein CVT24_010372 [Panaeolus cyanescens]